MPGQQVALERETGPRLCGSLPAQQPVSPHRGLVHLCRGGWLFKHAIFFFFSAGAAEAA